MGAVFEEIAKQYLWSILLRGDCPVNFTDIGRWWGTNPKTRKQEKIDIVGFENKATALFAECKWTNEKVDTGVLDKLLEQSNLFNHTARYYYLFSKSGFTQGCAEKALKLGNIKLVEYEEILKG